MFICKDCQENRMEYCSGLGNSFGLCELCGREAVCLDASVYKVKRREKKTTIIARPKKEYHEDMGPVTWWRFPIDEPAWIGTPNDSDWPGYHTHFTPHPLIPCQPKSESN